MNGHSLILATLISLLAIQAASETIAIAQNCPPDQPLPPPKTVAKVDLNRYIGTWYEQASLPQFFGVGCEKTTANYSFNEDGSIKVFNTCEVKGRKQNGTARAYPNPLDLEKTNAKLNVAFPPPATLGDYWIVRLAEDYSYAVVSSPDYTSLWILSREKSMPQALYNSIIQDLKKDNFPVEKLNKTVQ